MSRLKSLTGLAAIWAILLFPLNSSANLVLPTTACDQQQIDFQIYGVSQHLTDTSQREDGASAFAYGASSQPFAVADDSGVVTFNFRTLFTAPTSTVSYIKLVGFSSDCAPVFGLGPTFTNPASPGDHALAYANNGHAVTLDGQTQVQYPSGAARYIWIEVWDGVAGSQAASYSYLVDIQDVQNPTDDTQPFPEPSGKRPVLIMPGILGTEMFKDMEELWANPRMGNPFDPDTFMDPLQFNTDLTPSDPSVYFRDVIRQRPFFNYSQDLINTFLSQGYAENENLFTFPYDWRYDVTGIYPDGSTNAERLQLKIQEILNQTHFQKIDIVAHSMGGLVVKQYVMDHPADNHINKAVLVGVPNLGAPKAIKVLTEGDNMNILGLSAAEMKKIARNMPGVYDLLPGQSYFDAFGSPVRILSKNALGAQVAADLTHSQTRDFMLTDHDLNIAAYNTSQAFHSGDFDSYDLRTAGVDAYTITGCKTGTLGTYTENRITGTTLEGAWLLPKVTSGDGTVPYDSANTLPADVAKRLYAVKPDHGKMLSQNGIRQEIVNLIAGSSLVTGSSVITRTTLLANPDLCKLSGRGIKVLSPVNIEVMDNLNNRLGLAPDGSLQNDIPGADFEISGDHKFVYLPQGDGETYTINLAGTDTGTFTIQEQDIANDVYGSTRVFPNLPVTQSLKGTLNINTKEPVLDLDTDGDGDIDQTLAPSSVLDANQSQDFVAPITTPALAGRQGKNGWYTGDVKARLTASDDNSGVFQTFYSIGGGVFSRYQSALDITATGTVELLYFSVDRAGNSEAPQALKIKIDKSAPELTAKFDTARPDFVFGAVDDIDPNPQASCTGSICALTDQAGNVRKLAYQKKQQSTQYSLLFKASVRGDGRLFIFPANRFSVDYGTKQQAVAAFRQTALIPGQKLWRIDYNKERDASDIAEPVKTGVFNRYTLPGKRFLTLTTDQNNLSVGVE